MTIITKTTNNNSNSKSKKDAGFTESARAGLAAKEDYTSVKLKRSDSLSHAGEHPPYKELMLIQVKGKKKTKKIKTK
jgi:hypothetical protein